jgi:hypothetical protein
MLTYQMPVGVAFQSRVSLAEYVISRRLLQQSVWVAAYAPKIRDDMIDMLIKAAYVHTRCM